jgi:hypothetical protein
MSKRTRLFLAGRNRNHESHASPTFQDADGASIDQKSSQIFIAIFAKQVLRLVLTATIST